MAGLVPATNPWYGIPPHISTIGVSAVWVLTQITQILPMPVSVLSPYEIYMSPYTGNIYFTDAKSYATAGYLYGYRPDGTPVFAEQKVYINPAHIIALPKYK